jgi:hypothetical protein
MRLPDIGFFPQTSQTRDIVITPLAATVTGGIVESSPDFHCVSSPVVSVDGQTECTPMEPDSRIHFAIRPLMRGVLLV